MLCCGLASWANNCSVLFSQELVEFYQQNSLKDCFKSLDTTLQFPYKEPERRAISKPPGRRTPRLEDCTAPSRGSRACLPPLLVLVTFFQMLFYVTLCDVGGFSFHLLKIRLYTCHVCCRAGVGFTRVCGKKSEFSLL